MSSQLLICPHCSKEFPLTEAVSQQLKEHLHAEVVKNVQDDNVTALKELQEQLDLEKAKRKLAEETEISLRKEQQKLKDEQDEWELKKQREMDDEREAIREKQSLSI
jgi:hypothetical protein